MEDMSLFSDSSDYKKFSSLLDYNYNVKMIDNLYKCLYYKDISFVDDITWINEFVDLLLNYDNYDLYRPDDLRLLLFDKFVSLYNYKGFVYHGFMTALNKTNLLNKISNKLLSFSYYIDSAIKFTAPPLNNGCSGIICFSTCDGFNFNLFLQDIYRLFSLDCCIKYFTEYEVLCYLKGKYSLIDFYDLKIK